MTMSKTLLVLLATFFPVFTWAQACSNTPPGLGASIPQNVSINGQCLTSNTWGGGGNGYIPIQLTSWYNNTPNSVQVCWNTSLQSDSLLMLLASRGNGFSAPDNDRLVYSNTLTTNHCVTATGVMPGKLYLLNVASCGTGGSGGIDGLRCARTDPNWSSATYGSQYMGFEFTAPPTTASNPLSWSWIPAGPSHVYQGHAINADLVGLWTDGPMPTYIVATNLAVDGQACTAQLTGATCGPTTISVLLDVNDGETVNSATNNYSDHIFSSGTYRGDFYLENPQTEVFAVPGAMLRIMTTSSTGTGSHLITGSFQATDSSQNPLCAPGIHSCPVSLSYAFSVLPPASFSYAQPTNFPSIPGLGSYNAIMASTGTYDYTQWKLQNTAQGIYNNDGESSGETVVDFIDLFNYSGERVAFQFSDYVSSVTAAWQQRHNYQVGDMICTRAPNPCLSNPAFVFVVTSCTGSCTSGGSTPVWNNTVDGNLGNTPDNQVTWTNAGNADYWNAAAQRVLIQHLDTTMNLTEYSTLSEWNIFPLGIGMDYFREGGKLAEYCNKFIPCQGLQANTLAYMVSPLISSVGIPGGSIIWTYKYTPADTIRSLPYYSEALLDNWLVSGTPVVDGSVDELQARVDLLLQTIDEVVNYNPVNMQPVPCCISAPSFDLGLLAEALIDAWTTETYWQSNGQLVTPDARIPVQLMQLADWYWSNRFNQLGSDYTSTYSLWMYPESSSSYNFGGNHELNNLMAPMYAWLFGVYGDGCRLPTSGIYCQVAADTINQHALDAGIYGGKAFNQIFKWQMDFYMWRTGLMPGTDSYILPTHNPQVPGGTIPNQMEPFNGGSYPSGYPAAACTSVSCTITWYTFEKADSTSCKMGTSAGNLNIVGTGVASVYVTNSNNQWTNSCTVNGLAHGTAYYFGIGGTDGEGNSAFSSRNPANGNTYQATTQP
jgi:hypothetical protein